MPALDIDESEGFIDAYETFTQQARSPHSPAFSSPPGSAGLKSGHLLGKSAVGIEAYREPARALSVHELRDEMGKMRSELEMLKIVSVPPHASLPYPV
ncbi:hypothetical protein AURDEDRAFT_175126 [Auricularia subglabra TFB-10046 SS5]|nr:hypothetical protein AURDEDRAFT_175126 [Auricularia subglabra TFB-10046 SS5]